MGTLSPGLQLVWQLAASEAGETRYEFIEREHLCLAFCRLSEIADQVAKGVQGPPEVPPEMIEGLTREVDAIRSWFDAAGIKPARVHAKLRDLMGTGSRTSTSTDVVHRSDACRQVFSRAEALSREQRRPVVHLLHLLAAVLDNPGPRIAQALRAAGGDVQVLERSVHETVAQAVPPGAADAAGPIANTFLSRYGVDLVHHARSETADPLVGRRAELLKVARVLTRHGRGNPVLIGEAGVGKTAIVHGLAWRIAHGTVVAPLRNKRIVEISLGRLVGGTKHRGELEERLTNLAREASADPNVILFLDEIHALLGGGSAEAILAANLLKPALASGQLSCIGSTTEAEYQRHIERDPALSRRFQPVRVAEPSRDEAVAILEGLRARLESHHQVAIQPAALRAAVDLSTRYLPDRKLPDKAIELVDDACTHVKIGTVSFRDSAAPQSGSGIVTPETITNVLAEWTGRPVASLGADDRVQLQTLAARLRERVIGQDDAAERLAVAIAAARSGLREAHRPLGVFLFAGPTGVGKTELSKGLANVLFGADSALVRLDMSEYGERHTVSRLVGSPPGYIGHDEEGQLTGRLHQKPYSVVLLDEIEKAHPDVRNVFLQLFDEGRLTDARGRTVDGRHALFIMTSNVRPSGRHAHAGFGRVEDETLRFGDPVREALREVFTPEFVNRIDDVIEFRALDAGDLRAITAKLLRELQQRALDQHVAVDFDPEIVDLVLTGATDSQSGARQLARAVEQFVGRPLSQALVVNQIRSGDHVRGRVTRGAVTFVPAAPDGRADQQVPGR